jgi:hypothetical protein
MSSTTEEIEVPDDYPENEEGLITYFQDQPVTSTNFHLPLFECKNGVYQVDNDKPVIPRTVMCEMCCRRGPPGYSTENRIYDDKTKKWKYVDWIQFCIYCTRLLSESRPPPGCTWCWLGRDWKPVPELVKKWGPPK